MATGQRVDPFAAFNFTLTIDGLEGSHGLSECSGANTEQDVIEYREGNMDFSVIKLPGLKRFDDITLKRGFTTNRELWDWRRAVLEGTVVRRTGHIVLNDEAGKPAAAVEVHQRLAQAVLGTVAQRYCHGDRRRGAGTGGRELRGGSCVTAAAPPTASPSSITSHAHEPAREAAVEGHLACGFISGTAPAALEG